MSIPHSLIKNQKSRFILNSMTVYFLISILTIGSFSTAFAEVKNLDTKLNETRQSDPSNNLLYTLLVAEIAASRDLKSMACENYFKAAYLSKDPAIAEQATLLAINFEKPKEAVLNALLWAKIDPKSLQAQLIAMTLLIGQSIEQATPYLKKSIALNPKEIDQHLLEIQTRLVESSANNLQQALELIAKEKPRDANIQFLAAQSASIQNNISKAKSYLDTALTLQPNLTRAIELKAQIIRYETAEDAPALNYLHQETEKLPDNTELKIFYANALLDNNQVEKAKHLLKNIKDNNPFRDQSLLLLGEIYAKEKNWKIAEDNLEKALYYPNTKDAAKYLLGEIAEEQAQFEQAIGWFSEVGEGPFHVPARLRAVILLKKNKQFEEAIYVLHNSYPSTIEEQKYLLLSEIDILNSSKEYEEALQISNDILIQIPEDLDVLFLRAITATKLQKWEMAENDFRKILNKNPDDPNVLNALGYLLSFNKNRLQEALKYSTQALNVAPNNPDFMDSVGWIYFQMGNIQQALKYLKEAFKLSQDNTIAAHLGEALWVNNQKEDALLIWKKALKEDSENEDLLDTLKRLRIDINQKY